MEHILKSDRVNNKEYIKKITRIVQTIMSISQNNLKIAQIFEKVVNIIFEVKIHIKSLIIKEFIFISDKKTQEIHFCFYFIEKFYLFESYLYNFQEFEKLSTLTSILIKIVFNQIHIHSSNYYNLDASSANKDLKIYFKIFILLSECV